MMRTSCLTLAFVYIATSLTACGDSERAGELGADASDTAHDAAPSDGADAPGSDGADADDTAPGDAPTDADATIAPDPGALVRVSVTSRVGYLLEDVPADLRDALAADLMARPDAFWTERVEMHLTATRYRLGYRRLFTLFKKGILPLPPKAGRTVTLDPAGPSRTAIDGHDVVVIGYTMEGVLLSDTESIAASEEALAEVGGRWTEAFTLPVDPDQLMQRTGMACIRELVETSDLLDADNALRFFDDTCTAESMAPIGCHGAPVAKGCVDAMREAVGVVDFPLAFERLPWDAALADAVRIPLRTEGAPDLRVLPEGLENHQILYSYIAPDSCSVLEQCVRGSGWRRLLRFDASLENVGTRDLSIGILDDSPFLAHNVFEYSACHEHFHFRFYGDFVVESEGGERGVGDKRAFCLLSTSRYANEERVPTTHEHDYCRNQGIVRGWGDDYYAGLDCQWIDITDLPVEGERETMSLGFDANPVGFLCEGTPRLDEQGEQLFSSTEYVGETGAPIDRPECDFAPGHADNNRGAAPVVVPARGGLVTLPCTRGQLGPRRDCGFTEQPEIATCTPGETVTLGCEADDMDAGQLVRVCETSAVLGAPLACTYRDALASEIVRGQPLEVSFTCPAARDVKEPGGTYALFHAPLLEGDAPQIVRCGPR